MMKTKTEEHATKCVVCGARLRGFRFGSDTCEAICTRAKQSGRTRGEQQDFEIAREHAAWADEEHWEAKPRHAHPGLNYNRPYLMESAA